MGSKKLHKKALCKWSKGDIENHLDVLVQLIDQPGFICRTCGRAANQPRSLCKAITIDNGRKP